MNSNYGYDAFVLDDNYYNDSFYNDMVNSIQIKNNDSQFVQKKEEGFVDRVNCKCNYLIQKVNKCQRIIYEKTSEIMEMKSQLYIFYILLIVAVVIIINQRMTINTLNQFLYIMKLQPGQTSVTGSAELMSKLFPKL